MQLERYVLMDTNKKIISKKLDQMMALLQVMDDLSKTGDSVVGEMVCATKLLKGLTIDVSALVDKGD